MDTCKIKKLKKISNRFLKQCIPLVSTIFGFLIVHTFFVPAQIKMQLNYRIVAGVFLVSGALLWGYLYLRFKKNASKILNEIEN